REEREIQREERDGERESVFCAHSSVCPTSCRHNGIDGEAPAPAVDRAVTGELPLQLVSRDTQLAGPVRPLTSWCAHIHRGHRSVNLTHTHRHTHTPTHSHTNTPHTTHT